MEQKKNHKWLMVDNGGLKSNLNLLVKELKNIYEGNDGIRYFYGGGKIPVADCAGSEIECKENVDVINRYIPIMKGCIKGHSNWCNMHRSEKLVANHLRFFCRVLTDGKLKCKTMRFPKFKSYMVKKYELPSTV